MKLPRGLCRGCACPTGSLEKKFCDSCRPPGKYRNCKVDGFDSRKEQRRYLDLARLETMGVIHALRTQVKYPLVVNGTKVCSYTADFVYKVGEEEVVEDAKGFRTRVYRLKKKLMYACLGIVVMEV